MLHRIDFEESFRLRNDPQEAPVIDWCCRCGGEIYEEDGAEYDVIDCEWTCQDCLNRQRKSLIRWHASGTSDKTE